MLGFFEVFTCKTNDFHCATLFEKSNFCPKIQFWQNHNIFTSFSPNFFLTIFLVKSKLSRGKKSKTTTFSRVFHPKKSTIFSRIQSWIFGQKMKISNSVLEKTQLFKPVYFQTFFIWISAVVSLFSPKVKIKRIRQNNKKGRKRIQLKQKHVLSSKYFPCFLKIEGKHDNW